MIELRAAGCRFFAVLTLAVAPLANALEISAPSLSLPIIIGLALVDAVNPCVIGVLILLLTLLLKSGDRQRVLSNGLAYTAGVYFTYLLGGLTLLSVFTAVRQIVVLSKYLYVAIGAFIILAGFLEVKDFFWYGRWFSLSIPRALVKTVEEEAANARKSRLAAFTAGSVLTLIELPCTGAPYLAVLTLMSQSGFGFLTALPLLLLYNLVFVLPLLAIIYLAYSGLAMKQLESWRKENRGLMRLAVGVALLAIGVWTISAVWENALAPLAVLAFGGILLMAVVKHVFSK